MSTYTSALPHLFVQYFHWFWLRQIQRNVDDDVFEELVNRMFEDSPRKPNR